MNRLPLSLWLRALIVSTLLCGGPAWAQEGKPDPKPEETPEKKEEKKEQDEEEDDGPAIVKKDEDTKFSLDGLIGAKNLWTMTPDQVEAEYKKAGFRWLSKTSKERGMIRPTFMLVEKEKTPTSGGSKPRVSIEGRESMLQFFNGKVEAEEVNFDFKGDALAMVTISVWNKGDAEDELNEKRFQQKVTDLTQALGDKLGVRAQPLGRDTKSAAKAERVRWETPDTMAQLEHSSARSREEGFRAEFIRVRLAPKTRMAVGTTAGNAAKVTQADLLGRVKKEANGDVYVGGVPMVDQGDKGYCALATSERVMRYYGIECDQHDMAKASGGDAFGTAPDELQDALHKLQNRFKIRVRDLIHWDIKDYLKFTEVYNREARRLGSRPCPENYFWTSFRGLDKDTLREARTKGAGYERFVKNVKDFTSRGVPLLWGLELGIYPENGEPAPQAFGGHMRLILGLNEKTQEIIFSDSWGAGHEMKRMALKDAYVVTKGLYMIEPQR
jgi:hypothetical protein